jgi:RNA polymerase sigma factor (sigma-70 family)
MSRSSAGIERPGVGGQVEQAPALTLSSDLGAIVCQIKDGNPNGIGRLYSMIGGIRLLLSRSLPAQEVDDVLDDVLIIVVQAVQANRLREPNALLGYAWAVTRNRIACKIRERIAIRTNRTRDEKGEDLPDPRPTPENAAAQHEARELMQRILEQLPARDREILVRFYLLAQNQQRIMGEMGLTPNQFRRRKSEAKDRFAAFGRRALTCSRSTRRVRVLPLPAGG